MSAPALAHQPVATARTSACTKRTRSWMVSADSTWPPGELMIRRIGSRLRVVASTGQARPAVIVEAIFSGADDGVWFRLTQGRKERVFSRHVVAAHRPLSAILRLIGDEVDLSKPPSEALLALLFRSLL